MARRRRAKPSAKRVALVALLLLGGIGTLLVFLNNSATSEELPAVFENKNEVISPPLMLELAISPEMQRKGLMFRKSLPATKGMLFVFPEERERTFWMKNTFLSLDIIYLNRDFEVVAIIARAPPGTTSPQPSGVPAKYVVELNGGKAAEFGVNKGSRLRLLEALPSSP